MCRQDSPQRPSRSPRPLQLVETAGKDLHHFLQHHFEYVSPKADKIWHRSTVVGFSCFLLALITGPAFILQHCFFGALVCLTESLASFAADYVFIEDDTHPAQRIDRYMCVVFVAVTWYDCIVGLSYSVVTMCLLMVPVFALLHFSRASTTKRQWVTRHFIWHLLGSTGVALTLLAGTPTWTHPHIKIFPDFGIL
ncbi:hypothetical protein FOZ60_012558 [Perkinsus olseni]|uniref:Uncharacterized protein n=1 Tax=Perkinsus olseni TaxID=32597 RepID=A0A7J6NBB0_PEROL|nr:hypothetical protein FOZ60_012558 [Perkinsus olseni]